MSRVVSAKQASPDSTHTLQLVKHDSIFTQRAVSAMLGPSWQPQPLVIVHTECYLIYTDKEAAEAILTPKTPAKPTESGVGK